MSEAKRNWVITGVSSGLGRAMAVAALADGNVVVGTVRRQTDLEAFEALGSNARGILVDFSDTDAVVAAIDTIERHVGPIEVLVNNAGYGTEGPVETISIDQFRKQYETNVFGPVAAIQTLIPLMRARGAGHVINISSATAYLNPPSVGAYASSKAALSCLSEILDKELREFGIKVTQIIAGAFRTDWGGRSLVRGDERDALYGHLEQGREERRLRNGAQQGDPSKFAAAILELVEMADPPAMFVLGADATHYMRWNLERQQDELKRYEALGSSTDFDPA